LLVPYFPLCYLFRLDAWSHVPRLFDCIPPGSDRFGFVPFVVRHRQVCSFRVWNIFSHRPSLLGMPYLLLLFDREDIVADAFGVRRGIQDFLWRIAENLDPMIDITSVTIRIVTDP
jgi:hypothetical protein